MNRQIDEWEETVFARFPPWSISVYIIGGSAMLGLESSQEHEHEATSVLYPTSPWQSFLFCIKLLLNLNEEGCCRTAGLWPSDYICRTHFWVSCDRSVSVTSPSSRHCINTRSGSLHHNPFHNFLFRVADVTHYVAASQFQIDLVSENAVIVTQCMFSFQFIQCIFLGHHKWTVQDCPDFSCK